MLELGLANSHRKLTPNPNTKLILIISSFTCHTYWDCEKHIKHILLAVKTKPQTLLSYDFGIAFSFSTMNVTLDQRV